MSEPTMHPVFQAGSDYAQDITSGVIEATAGASDEDVFQMWAGILSGLTGSMTAIVGVEGTDVVLRALQGMPDKLVRPQLSVVRGGRTDD